MKRIDIRVKTFILYLIASIILQHYFLFTRPIGTFANKISLVFSAYNLISYGIYAVSIYFIIKEKRFAWVIAALPSVWLLFNPLFFMGVPSGYIYHIYSAYNHHDLTGLFQSILRIVMPSMILLYSIINIITGFDISKKIKFIIAITFTVIAVISLSNIIMGIWQNTLSRAYFEFLIAIVFIGSLVLWSRSSEP